MNQQEQLDWCDILGRAIAGNGRLSDGTTLADKYPERYSNPLTDWVNLLIAESYARRELERIDLESTEGDEAIARPGDEPGPDGERLEQCLK